MTTIGHNNPPDDYADGWTDDMLTVQERMIQMVDVYMRLPDSERRFLADMKSSHPSTIADWMEHLAYADRPIDPITGRPDIINPKIRPAHPSPTEISRAMACDSWMGTHVVPRNRETIERSIMRRRVLRCVLILKAKGENTIWPTVKAMLRMGYAQRKRTSPSTLRRDYRDAIADIAAGVRVELVERSVGKTNFKANGQATVKGVTIGKARV